MTDPEQQLSPNGFDAPLPCEWCGAAFDPDWRGQRSDWNHECRTIDLMVRIDDLEEAAGRIRRDLRAKPTQLTALEFRCLLAVNEVLRDA